MCQESDDLREEDECLRSEKRRNSPWDIVTAMLDAGCEQLIIERA